MGPYLLSSLFTPLLHFEFAIALRASSGSDRHPDCGARKLHARPGELAARRLEQRMTEWISRDGDWRGALFDRTRPLLLPLAADGAALIFEDEI